MRDRAGMHKEFELLQTVLREIVYGGYRSSIARRLFSEKWDWPLLRELFLYHEFAPFCHIILKDERDFLPPGFSRFLENCYYTEFARYMHLLDECRRICEEAEQAGVTFVPIKGFSYAEGYYKKYGFRPLLDIDILVKAPDLERGVSLLERAGYRKNFPESERYWKTYQCHFSFLKTAGDSRAVCELHWALDCKRGDSDILSGVWARLGRARLGDREIRVLSPEDAVFSLALHQRRFGRMLNLKYICDLGLMLKNEDTFDWEYVMKTAYEEKVRASLYFLLEQTRIMLGVDVDKVRKTLRIPSWQKKCAARVITSYCALPAERLSPYYLYALCHMLLYDRLDEPVRSIIRIPQEQFAKFYGLDLYAPSTRRRYRMRFLYMAYRAGKESLRSVFVRTGAAGVRLGTGVPRTFKVLRIIAREGVSAPSNIFRIAGIITKKAYVGPLKVTVDITDSCDMRCVMCWYHSPLIKKDEGSPAFLPFARYRDLVREFRRMSTKTLVLCGEGEPLRHPDVEAMVEAARGAGLEVEVLTNAFYLDRQKTMAFKRAGVKKIVVSLHAGDADTYVKVRPLRPASDFDQIMDNLRFVKNGGGNAPLLYLINVISSLNCGTVSRMSAAARELRADKVLFKPLKPAFAGCEQFMIPRMEKTGLIAEMERISAGMEMANNLDDFCLFLKRAGRARGVGGIRESVPAGPFFCYMPWTQSVIALNGEVIGCVNASVSVGNIYRDSFKDIWFGKRSASFRKGGFCPYPCPGSVVYPLMR